MAVYLDGILAITDVFSPGTVEPGTALSGYRKFKLENALGDIYYLTEQNFRHFLDSPSGLGFEKQLSGTRVGNRLKIDKREFALPSVSGNLIFYDDSNGSKYDDYIEFVKFSLHYPLKLYYYTPGINKTEEEANSVYLNCEVTSASKSQIQQNHMLVVPVKFKGFSFWLKGGPESGFTIQKTDDDPGTFTFPLSFPFSFGQDVFRNISLSNNGTMITPVTYEVSGACVNPTISFYDENINPYATAKFIGSYDYVYVDSNDNNETIVLKNNGVLVANPASKQDLTVADPDNEDFFMTFLKLRPGNTYATLSLGSDFKGTVSVHWREEYVSL